MDADEIHTVSFLSGASLPSFEAPIPGGGPTDFMLNPQSAFPTRPRGAPAETYSGTGFVSSGIMDNAPAGPGAPPNNTFTLTFDNPGSYDFVCLVHPFQRGTVEVVASNALNVPSQADLDAQGAAELASLLAELAIIKQKSPAVVAQRQDPTAPPYGTCKRVPED